MMRTPAAATRAAISAESLPVISSVLSRSDSSPKETAKAKDALFKGQPLDKAIDQIAYDEVRDLTKIQRSGFKWSFRLSWPMTITSQTRCAA
jgi:hypothetical protein